MSENDLEIDLDIDLDSADDADQATQVVSAFADAPEKPKGLFVFEPDGDIAYQALLQAGIACHRACLGSEVMAAAQDRRLTGVILAPSADEELRELFVRALRGRFGSIPLIFLSPSAHNPEAVHELQRQGATAVLAWPLPPPSVLVPTLESLTQGSLTRTGDLPPRGSPQATQELGLLSRKLERMEAKAKPREDSVSREVFEQAVKEVAEKQAENTSLRSELTMFRERIQMLEERLARLSNDLAALTQERDELRAKLAQKPSGPVMNAQGHQLLMSLKKIGESVDPFLWGLEQAIQFLEELQLEAGDHRAPSLNAHLRSLKLVRVLLERLRERTRDIG